MFPSLSFRCVQLNLISSTRRTIAFRNMKQACGLSACPVGAGKQSARSAGRLLLHNSGFSRGSYRERPAPHAVAAAASVIYKHLLASLFLRLRHAAAERGGARAAPQTSFSSPPISSPSSRCKHSGPRQTGAPRKMREMKRRPGVKTERGSSARKAAFIYHLPPSPFSPFFCARVSAELLHRPLFRRRFHLCL